MAGVCKKALENGKFRAWYMDYRGKQKTFTGSKSKADTLRMAQGIESQHRQVRLGYRPVPASAAKHAARPFAEVAAEYQAWGESQGGRGKRPWGKTHARMRRFDLQWWQSRLGLETLADLDGILPRVEEALRDLQDAGRAGKTLAAYAEAVKALCQWCLSRGYLAQDPMAGFAGFDTTPGTKRRALAREEIQKLLRICSPYRRLVYETALTSGLRAGELRALSVEDLDMERCGLRLRAEWTKNRKPGFQPLPAGLAKRLEAFAASGEAKALYQERYARHDASLEGLPAEPLLYVSTQPGREIAKDLTSAGVAIWQPGEGRADFHSLRLTFVSMAVEAGASAKEAQELARHSTPSLTMNTYARARHERLAETVEAVYVDRFFFSREVPQ